MTETSVLILVAGALLLVALAGVTAILLISKNQRTMQQERASFLQECREVREHYERALRSSYEKLMSRNFSEYSVNKSPEPLVPRAPDEAKVPPAISQASMAEEAMRVAEVTGVPFANAYDQVNRGVKKPATIVGGEDFEG